ncbi:NifB/NifX family molybdenum-iron cluster-binding protein [Proteiniphilum acetatigenes]|jgi:predicted Fe-Mo cluster-binding NifX family protein|uniref:NifB/NifX family molybdenum-iron cluster-binding protein n=1 Tax=Proteiniphilum acetatigenes TaxID=294710 RepID=UPI000374D4C8|nr:NifB/NifX family molybdenum-iron cluster-binding protein [Proteiniphilum acetatigenes]SFK72644.1 Predicted Fe-Mo cluster-binding protein, NifX family [Porphyromonadaceae bacterium KH3CP3RA]
MKVAITSTGKELTSAPDRRFGRCKYFVIYDTERESVEFIENPKRDYNEGAGPASVQLVVSKGVEQIITGDPGGKAASIIDQLPVRLVRLEDGYRNIGEVIQFLKKNI